MYMDIYVSSCTYTVTHVNIYNCIYMHIYIYIYVCMYICVCAIYICVYTYTYIHTSRLWVYVEVSVFSFCICIHTYTYMQVYVYTYMHTYVHTCIDVLSVTVACENLLGGYIHYIYICICAKKIRIFSMHLHRPYTSFYTYKNTYICTQIHIYVIYKVLTRKSRSPFI